MKMIKFVLIEIIKLFPQLFIRVDEEEVRTSSDWVDKLCELYLKIRFVISSLPIQHFVSAYIEIVKKCVNHNGYNQIKDCWMRYFELCGDKQKLFMTQMFYLAGILDDDVSKMLISYATTTTNKLNRYWITMDISKMTFILQRGLYANYYIDRRELLKKIAEECDFDVPKCKKRSIGRRRALVISYLLDKDMQNSMQRVASMVANGICDYYDEVQVLSLESFCITKTESRELNTAFSHKASMLMDNEIQACFHPKVIVKYASGNNPVERMQDAINYIYKYNPDVIFDVSDEYAPISYWYSKDYFSFYIPLRGGGSSTFYTAIEGVDWKISQSNIKYQSIDLKKVIGWTFPEYVPVCECNISREQMGIEESKFLILTAGNNSNTLEEELIDKMCDLLIRNDEFIWILVGDEAPEYLRYHYPLLIKNKKIIEWGFEKNFYGLCKLCNVLLRPNMTGGSGATAIAAMAGLPIVMTSFLCDPMRWLGKEYSHIESYSDLVYFLEQLYSDEVLYAERRDLTLEKVHAAIDTKSKWEDLINKIEGKDVERNE